ncbi:MAG: hypothetical protein ABI723_00070 [Bacteroidia bacterium]
MSKKTTYVIIGIVALLAITNPTTDDFRKNVGNGRRTGYFLIFSTFQYDNSYYDRVERKYITTSTHKFIGVFKNFIEY